MDVSDFMIKVDDLSVSKAFLINVLQMKEVSKGDHYIMFESEISKQRIVITDQNFGSTFAVAVSTKNLEADWNILKDHSLTKLPEQDATASPGYQFINTRAKVPILLFPE